MQGSYLKTKKVYVFVNGRDDYKPFYIHPKCRMGWNAILAIFTTSLKPAFGAIRVLRTRDGRTIIDSFEDLKHEGKYVACGLETFKKGGYRTSSDIDVKMKQTEYYPTKLLSTDDKKKYPCLMETMRKGRTIIFVFANGKKSTPRKVVLIKSDYKIWDNILVHIGNILDIPEGVKGLCTIFGQPLCSPYEIQHGGYYVAIPFNATFKKMKYLTAKQSDSYHESSPLVTKGAYLSASKTCTSMEGLLGKRRRSKSSGAKQSSEEKKIYRSTKDRQTNYEDCVCIDEEVDVSIKKGRTKVEHQEKKSEYRDIIRPLDRQDEEANITDVDITEHQIRSEAYDQTEIFTQTSAICFESICDQENAIILNEKKFFLLTEEELQHLKDSNVDSQQPFETSEESKHSTQLQFTDQEIEEIREVAGNFVGVITKISEKMISKTVFGIDYVSIDSNQDQSSNDSNEKVVFFPDTLQPKSVSLDLIEERMTKSALSKKDKHPVDHLKSLRLSLPIGRGTILDNDESDDEIIPQKKVSLHSPPAEVADSLLDEIIEEYKPMTPTREIKIEERGVTSEGDNEHKDNEEEEEDVEKKEGEEEDEEEEQVGSYIPFFGLRRDSIGIPLISKLYGARKESIDEDEDETEEATDLYGRNIQEVEVEEEKEDNAEEEDEWKKLDIIEDMELDEDKVELFTDMENREETHIHFKEDETDFDEPMTETSELKEETPQMKAEDLGKEETPQMRVEDLGKEETPQMEAEYLEEEETPQMKVENLEKEETPQMKAEILKFPEEIIPEQLQSPEADDKETELTENVTSEHSKTSLSIGEEITVVQDIAFGQPQILDVVSADVSDKEEKTSDIEIEDSKQIEETASDQLEISNEEIEETKEIVETISDNLQVSNEETEETKEDGETTSDRVQASIEAIEDVQASGDITSDRSQVSTVEIEEKEASGDIISDQAEIQEMENSEDVTEEQPQGIFSDNLPEAAEYIQYTKETEDIVVEEQKIVSKYADEEIYTDVDDPTPVTEKKIHKKKEKVVSDKPKKIIKQATTKAKKKRPFDSEKDITKNDEEQTSLTSTKGSSSDYYGQKDLQMPDKIYGSLLETPAELARNSNGSIRQCSSSEICLLTQKSKVGSYCVTLNSWISMKVEECNGITRKNQEKVSQIKSTKPLKKDKHDETRNVKSEFEEERRRSLLNFMKMRIELALSNKIPELRQTE